MAYLILVRHGESEWNAKGLWTGLTDISLSEKGKEEARIAAQEIQDIPLDMVFTSDLKRAQETADIITHQLATNSPLIKNKALNERDYGELTGKNKWDLKKEFGDEKFTLLRRSFDYPIPGGETLKDVYNRVIPYYKAIIEPKLKAGKNVLIAAHGNSIRALIKYLDHISDENIAHLEVATGEVYVYIIDSDGTVSHKEIRAHRENKA